MFCIIWNKGCKRCRGDLSLERDEDSLYVACIQCGAVSSELTELVQTRTGTRLMGSGEERKQQKLVAIAEYAR